MQIYSFFQQPAEPRMYVQKGYLDVNIEPEFIWLDCVREDVVNRAET